MKILVIGESCSDQSIYCRVERLCPEGPIPVALPIRTEESYGMAANVRANLVSLGAEQVTMLCQQYDIIKTRYIDEASGYIMLRVDEHDRADRVDHAVLLEMLGRETWDAVVCSEYGKGFLHDDDIALIAQHCAARGIKTYLDTKKILSEATRLIDYVKINEREHQNQLRAGLAEPQRFCQNLIVTRGDKGCWWMAGGELAGKVVDMHVPVEPIEVSSLSGAGDTYLSAFVIMMTRSGGFVHESMDYANRVARIAVSKRGIVAVRTEDVV